MKMWKSILVALGLALTSGASPAQTGAEQEPRPRHSAGGDLVPVDPEPEPPAGMRPYADPDPLPASGGAQPRTESGGGDHSRVPLTIGSSPAAPPSAPMPGPQPRTENGYTWICGGVGADEAKQMKQLAHQHDLMLTFATSDGSFLADVNVEIAGGRGRPPLRVTCDGPIMLVDVPRPGTYRIRAESAGIPVAKPVEVRGGKQGRAVELVWPAQ